MKILDEKQKIEGQQTRGVSWFLVCDKITFENNSTEYFYKMSFLFPCGLIAEWDLMENLVWPNLNGFGVFANDGFKENVYTKIKPFAEGIADGVIDSYLSNEGHFMQEEIPVQKKLGVWKPRTKPTQKQIGQMRLVTAKVVDSITSRRLSALCGVTDQYIRLAKLKGVFAAPLAYRVAKLEQVQRMGITLQDLRPDIDVWPVEALEEAFNDAIN